MIIVGEPGDVNLLKFSEFDEMKSLQFRDGAPNMMTLESAATTMTTTTTAAAALALLLALLI